MAERRDLFSQIAANRRRTVCVMAAFSLPIVATVAIFPLAFAGRPVFVAIANVIVLVMVSGVFNSRNPEGLISAPEKLRDNPTVIAHAPAATAHPWIESPLDTRSKAAHGWFNRLFETHPAVEDRIAALKEVEGAPHDPCREFPSADRRRHHRRRAPATGRSAGRQAPFDPRGGSNGPIDDMSSQTTIDAWPDRGTT